jgi:lipopolysaccharide transport protein LptA
MAASLLSRAIVLAGVIACAARAAPPALETGSDSRAPSVAKFDSSLPISLEAQSTEFDYRNNNLLFRKVTITQGNMSVAADQAQATGLNFDNSRWNFHGKVRMNVEQGSLSADEAQIDFVNKLLRSAVISGRPAEFEQRNSKTGQVARGHAELIEYDAHTGTVKLSKDAYLTNGQYDIHGQSLRYSVRDQRVLADAPEQGTDRVHITITPPKSNQ